MTGRDWPPTAAAAGVVRGKRERDSCAAVGLHGEPLWHLIAASFGGRGASGADARRQSERPGPPLTVLVPER